MITFKIANSKRKVIEYFYLRENEAWHLDVHENGGTARENIEDSLESISEDASLYEVYVNDSLAAAFSKVETEHGLCMEFFHVGAGFRNADFLWEFWDTVRLVFLCREFHVGVFDQNKAAVDHLNKQSFLEKIAEAKHRNKIVHIFKSSPCLFQQQYQ